MEKFTPVVTPAPALPILIAERLRTQILEGVLLPGERLPPERALATSLNVSRSALREATRVLQSAGILDVRHGRGTFVAASDVSRSLADALHPVRSVAIAPQEVVDLSEVRRIVEPHAAALAAEHVKAREVRRLRELCKEGTRVVKQSPSDLSTIQSLNFELHAGIARASGNLVLARVVEDLMRLLTEIRRYRMRRPGRAASSWCEHARIVEALGDRDGAAAQALMLEHIRQAERASIVVKEKK